MVHAEMLKARTEAVESSVVSHWPAEESPLLEAVARERLVKTQQAGKELVGAVVICELWRLDMAL
jgi:hypothetical protein